MTDNKESTALGDITEMELTHGKVNLISKWLPWGRYKYAGRIRFGLNKKEKRCYIRITHKKSERHFRIYLRQNEFSAGINALSQTLKEAEKWGDTKHEE